MRKAAFHNLGCKVNSYETEAMQQQLEEKGYEIVPFAEGADVYVINTCSVTNIADRKSRQMLHKAKKMNPGAVVVAVGCYVQAAGEKLKEDEAIDIIIGNNKKAELADILDSYFEEKSKDEYIIDIGSTHEYESLKISKIADHTRAFIKIQDGCNQFCSYCIIPYTRGRVRSRWKDDIVKEVEMLTESGYQEIVLTGIHLSSYGVDLQKEAKTDLLSLMIRLDQIPGLKRLRLGSLEPRIITEEFAATLSSLRTVCPHFHLSLQSGCDTTLQRMNRRYTTAEYSEKCEILRKYFHNPAITTDVIVGFPGESEEEFEKTKAFLEQIQFYEMHVFKYSIREGTRAADMEHQIPEPIKTVRSNELLELNRVMSLKYRELFLKSEQEVVMEEKITLGSADYLIGHTREYIKAAIPYDKEKKGTVITGTLNRFLNDEVMELLQKDGDS